MSVFDTNSLLEQVYEGEIDTTFHLCPKGEYMAQITDLALREGTSEKVAVTWANLDVVWEILDDNVKKHMNMNKVNVRQQMFMDLVTNGSGEIAQPVQINWEVNRNMTLKRIMEATGASRTRFALNNLKFQTAWIEVDHEADRDGARNADGSPVMYARVKRVAPASAGQRR